MSVIKFLIIPMIFFSVLIGNISCFLQPVTEIQREFYIVDYDAPALRVGKPVKAELWRKNIETGKWEPIGEGIIPAGAYVKGKAPANQNIEDILKKENNGTGN